VFAWSDLFLAFRLYCVIKFCDIKQFLNENSIAFNAVSEASIFKEYLGFGSLNITQKSKCAIARKPIAYTISVTTSVLS
jgi:hypothetical protein